MARYDTEQRRLVLEIGVAGPHGAEVQGYLEHMCRVFRTSWPAALTIRVEETEQRLEWLEVHSGVVEGLPTLCRAFVVPDEETLWARYLARRCDAVVFVCGASVGDVGSASPTLERLLGMMQGADKADRVVIVGKGDPRVAGKRSAPGTGSFPVVALGSGQGDSGGHRRAMRCAVRQGLQRLPEVVRAGIARDFGDCSL